MTPFSLLVKLIVMPKTRHRKLLFSTRRKRSTRQKRADFSLAIVLFASVAFLFWLTSGTATASLSQSLSLLTQKISHTLAPTTNELDTASFVQTIEASDGAFKELADSPVFANSKVTTSPGDIVKVGGKNNVLAANQTPDGREKWIEVNLSTQHLYAHEGDSVAFDFLVSTGLPWTPTVTGEYRVWIKLRYANMVGGSKARGDYYNLPNVPYTMYFYRGYGIHGTYWHNNFGHPMSHGCVNVKTDNMARLYDWSGPAMPAGQSVVYSTPDNPGIRIVIHN